MPLPPLLSHVLPPYVVRRLQSLWEARENINFNGLMLDYIRVIADFISQPRHLLDTGSGPFISIHDGFQAPASWAGFLPGSDRIILDTHPYL
ncbi:hypothetical protein B0H14DRAFT_3868571 [Mycena olivaceomarginata]|nr:hypothetical protein B0H14DRAFT_3868571 [Mycena olivaceomarginata]